MMPCPTNLLAPQATSPSLWKLALLGVALCWFSGLCWGQVSTDEEALPTRILFVFDASNSMNAYWGGDRKIQTATRLLSETLKGLHQSDELELGLRVYGHGTKHVPGKQDCDDTELVVPFSSFNNLIIKQALSRIRAQGTTPIARSLELAAEDFPEAPGRNVIVLITDGIEACDEDPCAVSRALQAKGVTLKPFVIGMGMDDLMAELELHWQLLRRCRPQAFEHVLQLVLEQAMHNTTVQVDLLNHAGSHRQPGILLHGHPHGRPPPTMGAHPSVGRRGRHLVHRSLAVVFADGAQPARGSLDSLAEARRAQHHRHADMGTGHLTPQFARGVRTDYGKVEVQWHAQGACEPFYSSDAGERIRLRAGTYDLTFGTTLPDRRRRSSEGRPRRQGGNPAPGSLVLQAPQAATPWSSKRNRFGRSAIRRVRFGRHAHAATW